MDTQEKDPDLKDLQVKDPKIRDLVKCHGHGWIISYGLDELDDGGGDGDCDGVSLELGPPLKIPSIDKKIIERNVNVFILNAGQLLAF